MMISWNEVRRIYAKHAAGDNRLPQVIPASIQHTLMIYQREKDPKGKMKAELVAQLAVLLCLHESLQRQSKAEKSEPYSVLPNYIHDAYGMDHEIMDLTLREIQTNRLPRGFWDGFAAWWNERHPHSPFTKDSIRMRCLREQSDFADKLNLLAKEVLPQLFADLHERLSKRPPGWTMKDEIEHERNHPVAHKSRTL